MIEDGEPELEIEIESHGGEHTHARSAGQAAQEPVAARVPVLAAVVERDGRYLVCRRPAHKRHGGLWEFPGGKLHPGESTGEGIRRELAEELRVAASAAGEPLFEVEDPGSNYVIVFVPVAIAGEPACLEHEQIAWLTLEELGSLPLAPSDRRFVEWLRTG